jgi:hypothetical protein
MEILDVPVLNYAPDLTEYDSLTGSEVLSYETAT